MVIDGDTYYIYSKENVYPNMKLDKVNGYYIYIVIKETVGQYTGLHDKNGKEIYEGDIVSIQFDLTSTKSKVEWLQEISGFIVNDVSILDDKLAEIIVVIGNIYDNPELLEVSQ